MKLEKHPVHGYVRVVDPPSEQHLSEYYSGKYFSENQNYAYELPIEEVEFKEKQAAFLLDVLSRMPSYNSATSIVEVGSGEGFFVAQACARGLKAIGVDYDISHLHPNNLKWQRFFTQSSKPVQMALSLSTPKTCLVLRHVIEHVRDPEELIAQLAAGLGVGGRVVLETPHDFKPLQAYLKVNDLIDREYWLTYPDHLSYFSPESLSSLLKSHGFEARETYSDFPIEMLLFSEGLNYQRHPEMGKLAHLLRCVISSYLYDNSTFEDLLSLYRSFCKCKIGRSFTIIAERLNT